ncbi:hypothetical protein Acsp03_22940 [Actinomadura sp. NBRC 104412]|nr:hypothetical protein Acsp03_22940 [Actinomadura sp. NBRC 104412]
MDTMCVVLGVLAVMQRKVKSWSVDEARKFLESARKRRDPLYAAYVLILVLGLRRGEMLGLRWEDVDLDKGELTVGWQLQRINGRLLHRETKTESSDAVLPLLDICVTALQERKKEQEAAREQADEPWPETGLVFTTRTGQPVEPRNFNRSFVTACAKAGVRRIPVHATRKTCASLLVAMDVHPRVAMQILRHSQISVTMNVYSEVSSVATRRALKRLGKSPGFVGPVAVLRCCTGSKKAGSHTGDRPLSWVELRGFEPLTPSMRTRCATGLRYSPRNLRKVSKLGRVLAQGFIRRRRGGRRRTGRRPRWGRPVR